MLSFNNMVIKIRKGDILNLYAEIILNSDALEIDRPFTYKIPNDLVDYIKIGQIVKVPFGLGNKQSTGFVLRMVDDSKIDTSLRIKNISTIITKEPIVTKEDIELIEYLRDKYLCKYIDGFRLLIPTGILKGG